MESDQPGGDDLGDTLKAVERHFDHAISLFRESMRKVMEDGDTSAADADKTSKMLHAAMDTLLRYKIKVREERERHEGIVNGYALDLDAARSKVRRLLDRLRAHHNPG